MSSKLKRVLPIAAVVGALVALVCIGALASTRQRTMLEDTGATRRSVETTVAQVQALQPDSLEDKSFQDAIVQAENAPYVVVVWLFTPDGLIVRGNRAFSQGTVEASATEETHRVLSTLPKGTLDAHQRTALLAASVMQAEGEHNDVFRHLLRRVQGSDGELIAWIGATYDVSPAIGAPPSATWILLLAGWLSGMGTYWLSLPVWVWLDARQRDERAWVWAVFVLLGNLMALITYILARRPRPRRAAAS